MSEFKLTIGHLYPDLLNLYGDLGNIIALKKRCEWRGIELTIKSYELNDDIDFDALHIVFLGGGSDREQKIVCDRLRAIQSDFFNYVENNGVAVAVCGGYQLLGHYYQLGNEMIEGLSILDIYTEAGSPRLIGNVVVEFNSNENSFHIVGFENHSGRTFINNHTPLGKVKYGFGNNGKDFMEGVLYKNVIGTYLHGPLFPKNPELADFVITNALKKAYPETFIELPPLDDSIEQKAKETVINRFMK
jgi:CobQ-like glutamine amidotransferase family enzyme